MEEEKFLELLTDEVRRVEKERNTPEHRAARRERAGAMTLKEIASSGGSYGEDSRELLAALQKFAREWRDDSARNAARLCEARVGEIRPFLYEMTTTEETTDDSRAEDYLAVLLLARHLSRRQPRARGSLRHRHGDGEGAMIELVVSELHVITLLLRGAKIPRTFESSRRSAESKCEQELRRLLAEIKTV